MYACVKEVCRLLARPRFDTFHQLLIIAEEVRKLVTVTQSAIKVVRRVVKQLQLKCSSSA
jgi:hypothetical protein